MIVAGETSGELYGALLADRIHQLRPDVRIIGVGGERMERAGVERIAGISSAFGLSEAFAAIRAVRATFRKAAAALKSVRPAVLVLIDYPDFNLKLAAEAKAAGIPVLYYVSPQVWAWRKGRIGKIASLVDRMAVVLPFEEGLYRGTGLGTEFVGHPVWDEIRTLQGRREEAKERIGLDRGRRVLAILPGSRPSELKRLLPVLSDAAARIRREHPDMQFCLPLAPNTNARDFQALIDPFVKIGCRISAGDSLGVLAASNAAVIASGTATLQAALLDVPMVVVYRVAPFTYWLGRKIVTVKHISLVNILGNGEVVRELLQQDANPETIAEEVSRILADSRELRRMREAFSRIRTIYSENSASERVAAMVAEMAGWTPGSAGHASHL